MDDKYVELFKLIFENMESSLSTRGGQGYGVSHPYQRTHGSKRVYGKSAIEEDYIEQKIDHERQKEIDDKVEDDIELVKISKAFEKEL